jgi:hypothetical protein
MKCKEVNKKLIFLIENSLTAEEEKSLLQHLISCSSCKTHYDYLLKVDKLVNEEKLQDVSPYFYTKLSGRLESVIIPERIKLRPVWIKVVQGSIVAIIIIAAFIFGFVLGNDESKYNSNNQSLNQANSKTQTDITVTDGQYADNFPTY